MISTVIFQYSRSLLKTHIIQFYYDIKKLFESDIISSNIKDFFRIKGKKGLFVIANFEIMKFLNGINRIVL